MSLNNTKFAEEIENLDIKNLKYWSSHYAKEAEKLENFFKIFGFDKNDLVLSPECTRAFATLVSIAQYLKLDNTDQMSYISALREQIKMKFEKENLLLDLRSDNEKLNDKLISLNLFQEVLIKDWKALNAELPNENQQLQDIKANNDFMQSKLEKYNVQTEQMMTLIEGVDENVLHEKILADYQSLQALKKQLLAAKSKLDTYQDLPANSSLAELKKQAVKNEIASIEQQIEQLMNIVA